jgi:hypothetical protein
LKTPIFWFTGLFRGFYLNKYTIYLVDIQVFAKLLNVPIKFIGIMIELLKAI